MHASIRSQLDTPDNFATRQSFDALENEFAQWWEMATVLIEVGSTGTQSSNQSILEAEMSPTRSRRITLASDEAKQAGETLLQIGNNTNFEAFNIDNGPRKTSMPDPETVGAVAQLAHSEQWRASTGRQDLSKRQLEVLRTMLRTPVPRPTIAPRISNAVSASSSMGSATRQQHLTATMRRLPASSPSMSGTPKSRISEDVSFPSPSDSDYMMESPSFPSPQTASSLAQPSRPPLKGRRSSKAGLVGLKDFLKSLKRDSPSPGRTSPTKSRFSRNTSATPSRKESASPRTSPATSSMPNDEYDPGRFPTSRTSLSISASGEFVSVSNPIGKPTPPLRCIPSPDKGQKRPSIRNIFRTSSGNWSELVRGGPTPPLPPNNAYPSPSPGPESSSKSAFLERRPSRSSRKSQEGKRRSVDSGGTSSSTDHSRVQGLPNKPSRGALGRIKTPTSNAFNFTPPWKSSTSPRISKIPIAPAFSASPTDPSFGGGVSRDQTIRPRSDRRLRDSRGLGLGSASGSPSAYVKAGRAGASTSGASSVLSSTQSQLEGRNIAVSNPIPHTGTRQRDPISNSRSASEPMVSLDGGGDWGSRSTSGATLSEAATEGEEEVVVALTPENLPVLLEYLRQCEARLGEWKIKVENAMAVKGVGLPGA